MEYVANGLFFYSNIKEMPINNSNIDLDTCILIGCKKGQMTTTLDYKQFLIKEASLLLCKPNSSLSNCYFSNDFDGFILGINKNIISEFFIEHIIWDNFFILNDTPIIKLDKNSLEVMHKLGDAFMLKFRSIDVTYKHEIILSIVKACILEILTNISDDNKSSNLTLTNRAEVIFKKFMELIISNRYAHYQVSWYADKLFITPKYLSTICKIIKGMTAHELITEQFKSDVSQLLHKSNQSIKEIAIELKFSSISSFGKFCRKHFGMSPTEYRKQHRDYSV